LDNHFSFLIDEAILPISDHSGQPFSEIICEVILRLDNELARTINVTPQSLPPARIFIVVRRARPPARAHCRKPFVKFPGLKATSFYVKICCEATNVDDGLALTIYEAIKSFSLHISQPFAEIACIVEAWRDDYVPGLVNVARN